MEERIRKTDRRVVKTKKAIRAAFVKLMGEKDVGRITVKEIAEEANVDRKTVYNYYNGVHEIGEELSNELYSSFKGDLQNAYYQLSDLYSLFGELTKKLSENLELYGQIINLDSNSYFFKNVVDFFRDNLRELLKKEAKLSECEREFTTEYIINGLIAAYRCWFNSDRTMSLEEFSAIVGKLVFKGLTLG